MVEMISSMSKSIIYSACEKYAKSKGVSTDSVQIALSLNEQRNDNVYSMLVDYTKKEEYSIMDIIGVRVDFGMYSKIAPPFIYKALVRHSERLGSEKVSVMCVPYIEEVDGVFAKKRKKNIKLFLYNGIEFVEEIEFSEGLFSESDMAIPQQ